MSKAPVKKSTKKAAADSAGPAGSTDDTLPGVEEIEALFAPVRTYMGNPAQERPRRFLDRLALAPPQVLLLEGGTAEERLAAAHYWMLLLNCNPDESTAVKPQRQATLGLPGLQPSPEAVVAEDATVQKEISRPCMACPSCVRMITHLHRDCFFLDGLTGSIKIDDVRAVRAVLGEPPREAKRRIVIFREAQSLVEAAANALLKSFEEPREATSFIMLTPQRERLLPTLVSRSFVLSLPWPLEEDPAARAALAPWEAALCQFLRTGRGLFDKTGSKGAVDVALAQALTGLCRRALSRCMRYSLGGAALPAGPDGDEGLESLLARLPEARMRMLDEALAECQDSLIYSVNPALVIEWLATRIYLLLPRGRR